MISCAHKEIFAEACYFKPNFVYNYTFPIQFKSSGIWFGAKSIGKWKLQNKFSLNWQDLGKISLCENSKTRQKDKSYGSVIGDAKSADTSLEQVQPSERLTCLGIMGTD